MTTAPRVAFRERQRLFAADLTAEQEYRLGVAGRHLLAAHDWGVVSLSEPTYAIDGYGRELLNWQEPAPVAGEPNVWVYYCEQPPQSTRPCESAALARIEQRAVATTSASDDLDPGDPDPIARILAGRAAGTVAGAPAWPVALTSNIHYASLTAAALKDVQGNMRVQIGRTALTDPFWFVLWKNPGTRRYAADPAKSWFWGDLLVSSTRKAALLTVSANEFVEVKEIEPGAAADLLNALKTIGPRVKLKAVASAGENKITPDPVWSQFKDRFTTRRVTIDGLNDVAPDFQQTEAVTKVNKSLLMVPSATPPAVTAKRQIAVLRPNDPAAAVPVQIQCGPLQDSDFSTRFSVTGSFADRIAGMSVTGEGGVRIGGTTAPAGDPRNMIFVNGTLELPPVKASILDPLFNPLLVLTYIAGLRRANSFGAAWLTGSLVVPAHVGVGEDFTYTLILTPHIPQTIQTTHLLERFRSDNGNSIQDTRTESPSVVNLLPLAVPLPVDSFSFGSPGDHITIEMELAIKVGDTQSSVVVPASNPIAIEEPPVLELDVDLDRDDFAPLGADWDYTITTEDRPATLSMQKLSVNDGNTAIPPTDVSTLPSSKNINYPAANDSKDVTIAVALDYQWQGNAAASATINKTQVVHVGGMKVEVSPPFVPGVSQNIQLKFTNISGAKIENIRNLKVDFTGTPAPAIAGFTNSSLHVDLPDTESTLVPPTPQMVDLTGHPAGSQVTLNVTYGLTRKTKAYARQTHILTFTL